MKYSLDFNVNSYVTKTLSAGGKDITYRAWMDNVYVQNPVDIKHQTINIYAPEAYFRGESINGYTIDTAPIFFPNTVGGYMPGPALDLENYIFNTADASKAALLQGYIVAAPGARGRTLQDDEGKYTGKAPACIVDLKAAVRYLRHNKMYLPGDTEKIISNGTSAGGALSSLLGATGNHSDYEPYLKQLGAAKERDDIFAASCYCPITNLENADSAYEWLFNGINDYHTMSFKLVDGKPEFKPLDGVMSDDLIRLSDQLKVLFPPYLNSLNLKNEQGELLLLDEHGNGTFKDLISSLMISSAQKALMDGADLSDVKSLTIDGRQVTAVVLDDYMKYATRMKSTPAFDKVDLSSPENDLFGTENVNLQHFSAFSAGNSAAGGQLADPVIIKMMNPMHYITDSISTTARNWRIRHGALDRDTSLAVSAILATALRNSGCKVDYELPWGVAHAGDYDLPQLFAWIDTITK